MFEFDEILNAETQWRLLRKNILHFLQLTNLRIKLTPEQLIISQAEDFAQKLLDESVKVRFLHL